MNITHLWPEEVPGFSREALAELMRLRQETFRGFAEIEAEKGFVKPTVSISTTRGQDTIRLMAFRVIEEVAESIAAIEEAHCKEEAIDALNYLLSLFLLDKTSLKPERTLDMLEQCFNYWLFSYLAGGGEPKPLVAEDFQLFGTMLCGQVAEGLRNRSWMHNAQDTYFSQQKNFYSAMSTCVMRLLSVFESWDEFYCYYVGKDRVLQFRLKTNY